jgi:pimeloyl-ACP methyl ester carboxylesterase
MRSVDEFGFVGSFYIRRHWIRIVRRNPRVVRVVAINPYDYAQGRGMARSSLLGRMTTYASLVPVLGETAMRPDRDWARPSEREHQANLIPGVQVVTLERGGHFLALDRPRELSDLIIQFSTVRADQAP